MSAEIKSWMEILKSECDRTSVRETAQKIGYARTSISLVLSGRYVGSTERIAAAVVRTFSGKIDCPHLGEELSGAECDRYRNSAMPMSDPQSLKHWNACQTCAFNKDRKGVLEDG